jgi:hypothetical protein
MANKNTCPQCGSSSIISPARLRTSHEHDPVRIVVDGDPGALLLKGTQSSDVAAHVCSECGHVDLYVADVAPLADAFKRAHGEK